MTFTTAVAGPSRAGRVSLIASRVGGVRRASSAATEADTADDAVDDADVRRAKAQEKAFWEGEAGYTTWMSKVGSQYRTTAKGQRAKWLGGRTPYITNPSFRPPPPLSNDIQDLLYEHLKKGTTVSQLAHQFNVSKARIEAVRKLKEVEAEFKRQDLPLQQAYLQGMEPLLGAMPLRNPRTNAIEPGLEREEASSRGAHPSSGVERVEEERWELGIGQGGVFADRATNERSEGIERTVWEFRSEEAEIESERSKGASKGLAAGPSTPELDKVAEALEPEAKAKWSPSLVTRQSSKKAFRFVDTAAK